MVDADRSFHIEDTGLTIIGDAIGLQANIALKRFDIALGHKLAVGGHKNPICHQHCRGRADGF